MAERPAGRIARWRARLADHGVGGVLRKFVGDHVFRVSTSVVMEHRVGWAPLADLRLPAGVTTSMRRRGDAVPPLCAWLAHRQRDFQTMLDAGKLGLFVLRDGVAVGCVWASTQDHRDRRSREFYRVGPGEAYHYCLLLDPVERPRGLALPLIRIGHRDLRADGVDRMFSVVDRVNHASYRIQQRLGYRECGTKVYHLYFLKTRWTFTRRYQGTLGPAGARPARRPA